MLPAVHGAPSRDPSCLAAAVVVVLAAPVACGYGAVPALSDGLGRGARAPRLVLRRQSRLSSPVSQRTASGVAVKMELYVLLAMPINRVRTNIRMLAPPKSTRATSVRPETAQGHEDHAWVMIRAEINR